MDRVGCENETNSRILIDAATATRDNVMTKLTCDGARGAVYFTTGEDSNLMSEKSGIALHGFVLLTKAVIHKNDRVFAQSCRVNRGCTARCLKRCLRPYREKPSITDAEQRVNKRPVAIISVSFYIETIPNYILQQPIF